MTLGPFTKISPSPFSSGFSIFTFRLGKASPTEPGLFSLSDSAAITGDVSVKPYPCTSAIPKLLNPTIVSLSIGAEPYNTKRIFPPKLFKICLKITFLKSILHFKSPFDNFIIILINLSFP